MIDIHNHILPGLDDGAKDERMSVEMARKAASEGIKTIVATPHHKTSQYTNDASAVRSHVEVLNKLLQQENIDVTILPGQEIRITGELVEDYENGDSLPVTQVGNYMLLELPSSNVPHFTDRLLYDLSMKGIVPVIAHPERNAEIIENPDKLYRMIKNGAMAQVTSASVNGNFGKKIQRFSHQLIGANLVHFVASDAHNTTNRGFQWTSSWEMIEKKFGSDYRYMLGENAELLVAQKHVMKEVPERVNQRKFLGIF